MCRLTRLQEAGLKVRTGSKMGLKPSRLHNFMHKGACRYCRTKRVNTSMCALFIEPCTELNLWRVKDLSPNGVSVEFNSVLMLHLRLVSKDLMSTVLIKEGTNISDEIHWKVLWLHIIIIVNSCFLLSVPCFHWVIPICVLAMTVSSRFFPPYLGDHRLVALVLFTHTSIGLKLISFPLALRGGVNNNSQICFTTHSQKSSPRQRLNSN